MGSSVPSRLFGCDMRVMNFMCFVDKLVVDGGVKAFYIDGPTVKVFTLLCKKTGRNIFGPHDFFDVM